MRNSQAGPSCSLQAGDEPRQDLRQHDAKRDLPGGAAKRFGLDDLLARQLQRLQRQVADHGRRDADDDQRDLGGLAKPHDDEQDRQQRQRRHHRDDGDEGREQRPQIGQHADRPCR